MIFIISYVCLALDVHDVESDSDLSISDSSKKDQVIPAGENQEQKEIRLQGACAVVAAEVHLTVQQVYDYVGIEGCYTYAKDQGVDLVWVIRESYQHTLLVKTGVQQLSDEFNVDIDTVWLTAKWYAVLVDAETKNLVLYDQMKAVFIAERAAPTDSQLKPKPGTKPSEVAGMDRFQRMKGPTDSKGSREAEMEDKRKKKKEQILKKKRAGLK